MLLLGFSNSSKYFLAFLILTKVASDGIIGSDIITITYVLLVKVSIKAAKVLFRT